MELARNIYAFVLHLLGIYFVVNGVIVLFQGGGIAEAAVVTNGLLSVVAGLLFVISGQLIWILATLKGQKTAA